MLSSKDIVWCHKKIRKDASSITGREWAVMNDKRTTLVNKKKEEKQLSEMVASLVLTIIFSRNHMPIISSANYLRIILLWLIWLCNANRLVEIRRHSATFSNTFNTLSSIATFGRPLPLMFFRFTMHVSDSVVCTAFLIRDHGFLFCHRI